MNSKTALLGVVTLLLGLTLVLFVVPAQAGSRAALQGNILVTVDHSNGRWQSANLVLYNEDWVAIDEVVTTSRAYRFNNVGIGGYHVVAYNDENVDLAEAAVEIQSPQTVKVNLSLPKSQAGSVAVKRTGYCGGATGDGRFLKIYPSYGQTVIYLQCGRVVNKFVSGCNNCRASGGWRYVNYCEKTAPIYVNLPCPHR